MSVPAPGENGTMKRIGLAGKLATGSICAAGEDALKKTWQTHLPAFLP